MTNAKDVTKSIIAQRDLEVAEALAKQAEGEIASLSDLEYAKKANELNKLLGLPPKFNLGE